MLRRKITVEGPAEGRRPEPVTTRLADDLLEELWRAGDRGGTVLYAKTRRGRVVRLWAEAADPATSGDDPSWPAQITPPPGERLTGPPPRPPVVDHEPPRRPEPGWPQDGVLIPAGRGELPPGQSPPPAPGERPRNPGA